MKNRSTKTTFIEQGSIHKKEYFEGWYFKQVNLELKKTISFIFGYSTNKQNPHSFVQIIKTKPLRAYYIPYPLEAFQSIEDGYRIGDNFFSKNSLKLSIHHNDIQCIGELDFSEHSELQDTNLYMPNIMGPFTYIPNMECNHGVVSMSHNVQGTIRIDNDVWTFKNDIGYTEKDWGTSFPKRYIWIQGNHFNKPSDNFMCSLANIPFLGFSFEGLIAQLNYDNKSLRFATYTGAFKRKLLKSDNGFTLTLQRGFYRLVVKVKIDEKTNLVSPKNGLMKNTIKEGLGGEIDLSLYHFNNLVWTGQSSYCGVEIEGY
jgi:tocopherol cyclase